ncbi:MAG: transposase [Lentimicrobiaceae bacterium]|nr:transposase [Lentimicrobiaceae bacterium]
MSRRLKKGYEKNTVLLRATGSFFKQINMLIDWSEIEKEIKKVYKRGHSVDGRPAYSGLLLFKMLLLGIWYGLSDEKVEESVNDSLSMMRFCDLEKDNVVQERSGKNVTQMCVGSGSARYFTNQSDLSVHSTALFCLSIC